MAFELSKLTSLLNGGIKHKLPNRAVVGVDIGSSALKIVELSEHKGVPTLTTYGELQLGPYEGVEIGRTTRLPAQKLVEAFVDILRESSASSNEVAIAIPYNASFTTIITLQTTNPEKVTSMIPVEARKYVPVPLNEVTLDWFSVSAKSEGNTMKVLLSAIHNDAINRYESLAKGASLGLISEEIELFSTIRSVVSQKDTTVAIIDLGAGSTKLYIVHKGVIGKTHSVLFSGVASTDAVAKELNVSFREAEEIKRSHGLRSQGDDTRVQKAMTSVLDRGLREIHRVMHEYERVEEHEIEKVILSGSGALTAGLVVYASDLFARPVVTADPFSKVAYPAFLEDTLKEAGPSFAVAVGAALRGLSHK
jgi:type IV pilus assembly protein PilM